jgi:hypothetical protein
VQCIVAYHDPCSMLLFFTTNWCTAYSVRSTWLEYSSSTTTTVQT